VLQAVGCNRRAGGGDERREDEDRQAMIAHPQSVTDYRFYERDERSLEERGARARAPLGPWLRQWRYGAIGLRCGERIVWVVL
jgi:hypothetical protein